jgi:enoyl-CoA hydratase/carnithine racemase
MPRLDRDGEVCLLHLGHDENRFTPDWVIIVRHLLDEVAALPAPVALVTVAAGKFWSNGLDLDWLGGHLDEARAYIAAVQGLFARMLTMPLATIAASSASRRSISGSRSHPGWTGWCAPSCRARRQSTP